MSKKTQWRCFHCDEVFTTATAAAEHFGSSQFQQPACQIDIAEYRRMEEAYRRSCAEDTDLHREIQGLISKVNIESRRAEEKGYASGLQDARKYPETLGLMRIEVAA